MDLNWWDDHLQRSPSAIIFQSSVWSLYYRRYTYRKPWYCVARDGVQIVGLLLLFEGVIWPGPFADGGTFASLRPVAQRMLNGLGWSFGPVVLDESRRAEIVSAILQQVYVFAREQRLICAQQVTTPVGTDTTEQISVFRDAGYSAKKWATYVVDLTVPEEQLWNNLKGGGVSRTPVRKAERMGVIVRLAESEQDLRRFYDIMNEHSRLNGIYQTQYERWALMAETLQQEMKLFLAEQDGQAIAGAGVLCYNGSGYLFRPVQAAYCYEQKVYAGDLLQWTIIKWGHQQGMRFYDLAGVSPLPTNAKERGIADFKAKWGGRYIEYYEYYRTYRPIHHAMVRQARHLAERVFRAMGKQI